MVENLRWRYRAKNGTSMRISHDTRITAESRSADVIAVVTGGGQGIGRGVADVLAAKGWTVSIWDVDRERARTAAEDIRASGGRAEGLGIDVADPDAVHVGTGQVLEKYGRIDGLVTCAIVLRRGPLMDLALGYWNDTITVGLTGTFLCCQAVGRVMRDQQGGSIVNVASIAAYYPQTYLGSYSPVKAGVVALTQMLAVEWGPFGIRCNAISPGFTRTPPTEHLFRDPEALSRRQGAVPLRRVGKPSDCANVAAFLLSTDADYVSGVDIRVDGGFGQTLIDQAIGGDSAYRALVANSRSD
jgi:NAD(P)-dependent dehydrogenase (short-subunit alcohol dehydrogenase family)